MTSLEKKLRSCTGRICRIRHCIPDDLHNEIYRTLFESHLSYGISVWGNVSTNRLEPLFITQKKCIRILFGNKYAYNDKFETCARARPFSAQALNSEHFMLEGTKPLFNRNEIFTVHNLYKYHIIISTYKLLRSRIPISLYSLYKFSNHVETRLKSQYTACKFIDNSTIIWNTFREKLHIYDFNVTISKLKTDAKKHILSLQRAHDENVWNILNYEMLC